MPREPDWTAENGRRPRWAWVKVHAHPGHRDVVPGGVGLPKESEIQDSATEALARHFGDWIYDEQEELGKGQPESGSNGRGAGGLAAILTFIGLHARAESFRSLRAMAWKRFVQKARKPERGRPHRLHVSRGGAAYLAVAEIAERFGEKGPLEVEAVEEPSSIAGRSSELSYVGLNLGGSAAQRKDRKRYCRRDESRGGDVLGSWRLEMDEYEEMFLPPPKESEWVRPTRRKALATARNVRGPGGEPNA